MEEEELDEEEGWSGISKALNEAGKQFQESRAKEGEFFEFVVDVHCQRREPFFDDLDRVSFAHIGSEEVEEGEAFFEVLVVFEDIGLHDRKRDFRGMGYRLHEVAGKKGFA